MKFQKNFLWGIVPGVLMILASLIFLWGDKLFYFVIVSAVIIITAPFVFSVISESNKEKNTDEKFLGFVRDLVENVKSGTPISKSIVNLKTRDYGVLSSHVQKLANQIELGIPLTNALAIFAKDTKSAVISKSVTLISEAERSGGQIDTILESVAKSVNQIENLKKERKSSIYNLVVQSYIIFIVFLVIMLVLQYKILPAVSDLGGNINSMSVNAKAASSTNLDLSQPLFFLILVQSLFSGLVIGKISEGSIKDGIKHSSLLLGFALLISSGARAIF